MEKRTKNIATAITFVVTIVSGIYIPLAINREWYPFIGPSEAESHATNASLSEADHQEETGGITLENVLAIDSAGKFPILDITIINNGSKTEVLTEAHLVVKEVWKLNASNGMTFMALQPSATYQASVDLGVKRPFTHIQPISQSVSQDEADRFRIRLAHNASGMAEYILKIEVRFPYNSKRDTLKTNDLLLVASRPSFKGTYRPPFSPGLTDVAADIQKSDGVKADQLRVLLGNILELE